jgi:aryl-alcohol dehydrogenase-like predicted oxidoreductase
MKTVRLGKTGLEVSRIGMGGIPLTRPTEDESKKLEIREILAMPLKKALVVEST